LVVISVIGFLLSVIGAVVAHTVFVGNVEHFTEEDIAKSGARTIAWTSFVVMWIGFLLGIIALGIFAIRNLS
jgi:uncharacterized membrane protein YoaK (UPF0700 family)